MLKKHTGERTLILGTGPFAQLLMLEILAHPKSQYQVIGIVAESDSTIDSYYGYPLLGTIQDLSQIIQAEKPDRIIISLSAKLGYLSDHQLLEARLRRDIVIEDAEAAYENLTGKVPIEALTANDVIFSEMFTPRRFTVFVTRMFSFVFSLLAIVLLAPLFLLIPLIIKLDSRGPVLFVQDRVGLGGKTFKLYKFRTMQVTEKPTSEWAGDNSDRITRSGKWLRKFRLDELPQFFNVLANHMNLVGPRPHPASNLQMFVLVSRNMPDGGQQIPYYSIRLRVRPGITGWAQVRYQYANNLSEEIEKLKYDLYYVKNYSLWLDLRIIFETVKVVVTGREMHRVGNVYDTEHDERGPKSIHPEGAHSN